MKGKKLVFAVILSLIVCLLLVPSAYAEEQPTDNNSEDEIVISDNPTNPDGDNGGSDNDSQNNESKDESTDSGDSESKSDNDSTSKEGQSGVNDDSSDESKDDTGSDDSDNDTDSDSDSDSDTDERDNDSEEEESDTDSEDEERENASEEETESDSAPTHTGDSNLPPQPESTFLVELKYNGTSHKLDNLKGNEQFDLAEILGALGIPAGSIDTVQSGNDELFSAENGENGWLFTTKKAFTSEETLTVVVDGVAYVLQVIDDKTVYNAKDLQDELDNATDGVNHIIKLGGNITGAFVVPVGKTITIDLNGKTLTGNGEIGEDNLYKRTIYNKGTLTIKDSVGAGKVTNKGWHNPAILNTGNLTIDGGEFSTSGGTDEAWYVIKNLGTMTINGGTFTKDTKDTGLVVSGYFVENGGNANDHKIKYTGTDAQLTINGGMFENGAYSVKNELHSKLKITNGTFTGAGIYNITNESTTEITGGTFNCSTGNIWNCGNGKGNNGTITISGGNFTVADEKNSIVIVGATNITIKGGAFNGGNLLRPTGNKPNNGGKATINGGTFNVKNMTSIPVEDWTGLEYVVDIKEELKAEEAPANTITLTNDAPVIKYWVVEGKDQTWTKSGNESVVFTLNSSAVTKVLVDGVEVEFELDEDGKIVISAEVLEALEAGEHTVEFIFADGNCKTNIIIK